MNRFRSSNFNFLVKLVTCFVFCFGLFARGEQKHELDLGKVETMVTEKIHEVDQYSESEILKAKNELQKQILSQKVKLKDLESRIQSSQGTLNLKKILEWTNITTAFGAILSLAYSANADGKISMLNEMHSKIAEDFDLKSRMDTLKKQSSRSFYLAWGFIGIEIAAAVYMSSLSSEVEIAKIAPHDRQIIVEELSKMELIFSILERKIAE